ncbi:MAG: hypothetical protein R3247_06655, partial [Rhodothermales bacterium]|nr:hypothetical protein [Rhodothermales bacterium]
MMQPVPDRRVLLALQTVCAGDAELMRIAPGGVYVGGVPAERLSPRACRLGLDVHRSIFPQEETSSRRRAVAVRFIAEASEGSPGGSPGGA